MDDKAMFNKNKDRNSQDYDLAADLEKIKSALAEASRDLQGRAGQILNESKQNIKNQSAQIQDSAAQYITNQPFKSVGIALLSGIILGYILRKK